MAAALGHGLLARRRDVPAGGVVDQRRGGRHRPAVDLLAQAGRGELAQIAADAVLRQPELGRQLLGDHLPVRAQPRQQLVPALGGQHAYSFAIVHGIALS